MTPKPTAVVVRLPLSEDDCGLLIDASSFGAPDDSHDKALLAIGTPVAGGGLEVVGYITDNRPFDTNTLTHWILYKHRQHDREYGVVCQSDAQAALSATQAENMRLRDYLETARAYLKEAPSVISRRSALDVIEEALKCPAS